MRKMATAAQRDDSDDTEEYDPQFDESDDDDFIRDQSVRQEQQGRIRTSHPELWKDNVRKRRRNLVSYITI